MPDLLALTESQYRSALRAAVRGLWSGAFDSWQFKQEMHSVIQRHLTRGWYEGAKECDILPSELSPDERNLLQQRILYEYQWIDGLAGTTEENSQASGGKIAPLFSRLEIWIGRYEGVKSEARTLACADKKLEWVLGATEQHCSSCSRLNGKVKRASYWNEKGILPRVHGAPWLECQGFRCDCQLLPTDKPMSKGPLPRLP